MSGAVKRFFAAVAAGSRQARDAGGLSGLFGLQALYDPGGLPVGPRPGSP